MRWHMLCWTKALALWHLSLWEALTSNRITSSKMLPLCSASTLSFTFSPPYSSSPYLDFWLTSVKSRSTTWCKRGWTSSLWHFHKQCPTWAYHPCGQPCSSSWSFFSVLDNKWSFLTQSALPLRTTGRDYSAGRGSSWTLRYVLLCRSLDWPCAQRWVFLWGCLYCFFFSRLAFMFWHFSTSMSLAISSCFGFSSSRQLLSPGSSADRGDI